MPCEWGEDESCTNGYIIKQSIEFRQYSSESFVFAVYAHLLTQNNYHFAQIINTMKINRGNGSCCQGPAPQCCRSSVSDSESNRDEEHPRQSPILCVTLTEGGSRQGLQERAQHGRGGHFGHHGHHGHGGHFGPRGHHGHGPHFGHHGHGPHFGHHGHGPHFGHHGHGPHFGHHGHGPHFGHHGHGPHFGHHGHGPHFGHHGHGPHFGHHRHGPHFGHHGHGPHFGHHGKPAHHHGPCNAKE